MAAVLLCTVLLGAFYAATDGVLAAMASAILPPEVRGTGLATLVTATSIGRLLASVLFGALWTAFGYETAVTAFAVILVVALAAATPVLIGMQRQGASCVIATACCFAGICVAAPGRKRGVRRPWRAQAKRRPRAAGAERADPTTSRPLAADGMIVFRNLDRKRPSLYGFTDSAPLRDPAARVTAALPCSRVYFAGGRGLCLEPAGALVKQRVTIVDRRLRPSAGVTLQGVPSRARVSPDGRYGAVTFFVYGHSYATPGSFSTQTTIIDLGEAQEARRTRALPRHEGRQAIRLA